MVFTQPDTETGWDYDIGRSLPPEMMEALIQSLSPDIDLGAEYQLTDKGRAALDEPMYTQEQVDASLTKGVDLTIATLEVMQTENLTMVHLVTNVRFPVWVNGTFGKVQKFETWQSDVVGEARRNPKDKANGTIGVLAAFQDALAQLSREVSRRLEGELKHAEDCKVQNKARREAKAKKAKKATGGHASMPAYLLERSKKKSK